MRFDLHLRRSVRAGLDELAGRMAAWEVMPALEADQRARLIQAITPFEHTTIAHGLVAAGVDGSGDYPALGYADSFVYLTVAAGVVFESAPETGLRERGTPREPLVDFVWLTTNEEQRRAAVLESFERMAGLPVSDVIARSDYRELKNGGASLTVPAAVDGLIIPPAHDAGNLSIQFRSAGELGVTRRLIEDLPEGALVLTDGTMALPLVHRKD